MNHSVARPLLIAMAGTLVSATAVTGLAGPAAAATADGVCPPVYHAVPADTELRQRIDANTGSIDGIICAMELNEPVPHDRNLIDNMAR